MHNRKTLMKFNKATLVEMALQDQERIASLERRLNFYTSPPPLPPRVGMSVVAIQTLETPDFRRDVFNALFPTPNDSPKKIEGVKVVRLLTNCDLKSAKDYIEHYLGKYVYTSTNDGDFFPGVLPTYDAMKAAWGL